MTPAPLANLVGLADTSTAVVTERESDLEVGDEGDVLSVPWSEAVMP